MGHYFLDTQYLYSKIPDLGLPSVAICNQMPWTGRLTDIAFTCPPLNEFLYNISTMGIIEFRSVSVFDRGSDLDFLTGFKFFFKAAWSCQSLPCLSADLRVWLLFPFRVNIYGGRPLNSHPYQENQEKKDQDQLL